MSKTTLYLFIFCSSFFVSQAQINGPVVKQWDYRFGGDNFDNLSVLKQTKDGGYLLAGSTNSDSGGDVSQPNLGAANTYDYWVVKTDSLGNMQWNKRYGGNENDELYAALQTPDGGYLLGGYTNSDTNYYISQPPRGGFDFWIIKIDALGNKQWDKRFGGNIDDILLSMQQTTDGGYILGGYTDSNNGKDVSQPQFGPAYTTDYWIVKTDSLGNKLWDKRFGGDNNDNLYAVQQTADGGYILGGSTESDSGGSVTEFPRGTSDYWIVKTDSLGNEIWDSRFGGNGTNVFYALQQIPGGGYMLGGTTNANASNDVSQPSYGNADYWVVKTDAGGNKLWDKRYGGSSEEYIYGYITLTGDGGFLFSCASASDSTGDKTQNNLGSRQSWLIKTDSIGNKLWDKTIFTSGTDTTGFLLQTADGGYVIANATNAGAGGYKTQASRGSYDYWLVKFGALGTQCDLAAPVITTEGSTTICPGDSVQFCTSASLPFYQWNCGGINSCVFTRDSGDCYLVVMDTNNCIAESNHLHVTWRTVNGNSISAGSTIVCLNDSTSICVNSTFVTYNWNTGDTGSCITEAAGSYYVIVTDSNNCTATSNTVNITLDTVSAFFISAGRTTFCQGDTTAICAPPNFFFYYWSTDMPGACIVASDSGSYTVTVTDDFKCTAQSSNAVNISVIPLPPVNVIQHGDSLYYTGAFPCQWYSQGQPLPGETSPVYVIQYPGSYTVVVNDTNGCSATSGAFSITGVQDITGGSSVELYPNPTTGKLFIQTSGFSPQFVSIYDLNGRKISEQKFRQQMDIAGLPSGMYFIEVAGNNVVTRKKLVKL